MNRIFLTIALGVIVAFTLLFNAGAQSTAADEDAADSSGEVAVAIFAGGCFWCMEPPFDKLPGVLSTVSGYTDGQVDNPTYKQVSRGVTGHTEAVEIRYDPTQISYEELLAVFWVNIDPLAKNRQFCDRGTQYRSGIYYANEEEQALAEASAARVAEKFDQPIATEIKPASTFYAAEDYHQDYYQKNPIRYKFYRSNCGRDARLKQLWGAS
ncbi:MAG: peptide-methionine (S)-S-oxide reductase MsrA [Pseudomonadota bacterium]